MKLPASTGEKGTVQVGKEAPDFKLQSTFDREVTLSEFRGKWVALFFYSADFTGICASEVVEFNRNFKEFQNIGAEVIGVSVDDIPAHKAWAEKLGGIEYPLLSDIKKELSKEYGVLAEEKGVALRAVFIIDPEGIIRSITINDIRVGRSVSEVLRTLQALQTGEKCPAEWRPGEKTLGR